MAEVISQRKISRPGTPNSPPNCAICLGPLLNKSSAESCSHFFCFTCLTEWSKIKRECPLCKQRFSSVRHNYRPDGGYDTLVIKPIDEISLIDAIDFDRFESNVGQYIYIPSVASHTHTHSPHAEFMLRTTFTVDTRGERAIQQMFLTHPLTNGVHITDFVPPRFNARRRRDTSATSFRRGIYNDNLWVYAPPDITGRYREVTADFYRENPAARTRLVPWLNRELNALLHENTQQVMHLVDIIMESLLRHHICSRSFRNILNAYLGAKTDHFIHEFFNFMRSPFDMIGYDRNITYTERPISPIPPIDVSDYDDNSDVVLVEETRPIETIDLSDTDDDIIIVSEERPPPLVVSNSDDESPTVVPLKLTLKRKRKRENPRHIPKREKRQTSSSSSSSTSSSGSSSCSSSSSVSGSARRKIKKKKVIYEIANRNAVSSSSSSSTSTETSSSSSSSSSDASCSDRRNSSDSEYKPLNHLISKLGRNTSASSSRVFDAKRSSSSTRRHESHTPPYKPNETVDFRILPSCSRYEDSHTPPLEDSIVTASSDNTSRNSGERNLNLYPLDLRKTKKHNFSSADTSSCSSTGADQFDDVNDNDGYRVNFNFRKRANPVSVKNEHIKIKEEISSGSSSSSVGSSRSFGEIETENQIFKRKSPIITESTDYSTDSDV